jgi:nucleotide-sensitive chloride channel 1A
MYRDLILFQHPPTPTGISIPYPSIALHATMKWKSQVEALYMNISLNDAENVNDEEDIQVLEITVLPPNYSSSTTASSTSTTSPDSNTESNTACIKDIFSAMNTCADLHPDPDASDAEDEEDDTAPGATGWITADNMDEYLDEDGNFRGPVLGGEEELGPGAGTVRQREDEDGEGHVNGVNGVDGETKWQRTD